ncbi:MAG: crossover junction endodeoxyribonuclease RuvC [Candidatus Acetothermia bacterium]|nr:crossover junction endodeoxyribonuclease RuvC [Candidatus Acetothermia bacterium]MDH7504725.1 crossover junction endodeoxyribonuclease RuvC [Candidatus Acetothermia bacterium]
MRVMGIDPGLATTGYGIVETKSARRETSFKLIEGGVITTPPDQPLPERLKTIYDEVRGLVSSFRPKELAVEELYFARNAKTAISVAQARGVVLLAAAGLPVVSYTPLEVKLQLTGFGRATKQQIQGMVARLLGLREPPKPDDAADALAIALCHLLREGSLDRKA